MYFLFVVIVASLLWIWYRRRSRLDFPGPQGLPILGHILSVDLAWAHVIYADWAKKYGNIFKINMFGQEALVVSDIKLLNEMMVQNGAAFAGRPVLYEVHNTLGGNGNDIFFSQPSAIWKKMRKITHTAMRTFDTGLEKIHQVSMEAMDILLEELRSNKGQPIDPKELFHYTTMNIMASFLVGRTYEKGSRYHEAFLALDDVAFRISRMRVRGAIADAFPFLRNFINFLGQEKQIFDKVFRDLSDIVLEDSRVEEERGRVSIGSMLRKSVNAGEICDKISRHVIIDLIFAGSVTTTNTMYAFVNIMIHNQHVLKKLQEESDRVLGSRMVTVKDRESLPYHMATLQELLRYSSIFHRGF